MCLKPNPRFQLRSILIATMVEAGHLAFRQDNKPLSNLFLRMMYQLGIEKDRFGSSTGVLSEI